MPQVACGATPAPSLTLRVGKWDDSNCGDASAQAEFPGGVQRVVSEIGFVFPARFHPRFVLSHNMPKIKITNVTSKLALFWPFFSCRAIFLLRIHWPLATILLPHAPRPTPHAPRPTPHASRPTPHDSSLTSGVRSCADRPPLAILPSTDHRIVKDQARPDPDERPVHVQYVTEIQHLTESGNFPCQIHPFVLARRRPTVDHSLAAGGAQRQGSGRGSGRGDPLSGTWETWMAPNVILGEQALDPVQEPTVLPAGVRVGPTCGARSM